MWPLVIAIGGTWIAYEVLKESSVAPQLPGCKNMSCAQLNHVLSLLGYEVTDARAVSDVGRRLGYRNARTTVHESLITPNSDAICAVCPPELVDDLFEIMAQFKTGELENAVFTLHAEIVMAETERALGV